MDILQIVLYVLAFIIIFCYSSNQSITSKKSNANDRTIHRSRGRIYLYGLCAFKTGKILTLIPNYNEHGIHRYNFHVRGNGCPGYTAG